MTGSLLTVEQALERVLALARPLGAEAVPLSQARGRGLAEACAARLTLPPWDNSAMDGYAVRAVEALAGAELPVAFTVHAGKALPPALPLGSCARIMTGAPMPSGADAVVMQERVRVVGGERVAFTEPTNVGQHVRRRGEDTQEGAPLLAAGLELGVGELAALASQNVAQVSVRRRPRVAICSSGDELVPLGAPLEGGIVDSNSPALALAVEAAGGIPVPLGIAKDSVADVARLVRAGLEADVLLMVAGASVGERDFTRAALEQEGVFLDFWRVAMKPGKPLAAGRRGDTLVFALPGNPVSALVTFELFVRPCLRAAQGLPPHQARVPARTTVALKKPKDLTHFQRATARWDGAALTVTPLPQQSSGALTSLAGATCLLELPAGVTQVPAGGQVSVLPVSWNAGTFFVQPLLRVDI